MGMETYGTGWDGGGYGVAGTLRENGGEEK